MKKAKSKIYNSKNQRDNVNTVRFSGISRAIDLTPPSFHFNSTLFTHRRRKNARRWCWCSRFQFFFRFSFSFSFLTILITRNWMQMRQNTHDYKHTEKKEPKIHLQFVCTMYYYLSAIHTTLYAFRSYIRSVVRSLVFFFYISKMASYVSKIKIFGNRIEWICSSVRAV